MRSLALVLVAGCGRIGFAPGHDEVPASALLVHFDMATLSGTTLPDLSEYGHDGTCVTQCPTIEAGPHGNALRFDGVGTAITVASSPVLEQLTEYTIAFRARVDQSGGTRCMVSKAVGSGNGNSFQSCIQPGARVMFASWDGTMNRSHTSTTVLDGAWHHVALVWSGISEAMLVDGRSIATETWPKQFDSKPVAIGYDLDDVGPVGFFSGWLDDVRIYNVALSQAELDALAMP